MSRLASTAPNAPRPAPPSSEGLPSKALPAEALPAEALPLEEIQSTDLAPEAARSLLDDLAAGEFVVRDPAVAESSYSSFLLRRLGERFTVWIEDTLPGTVPFWSWLIEWGPYLLAGLAAVALGTIAWRLLRRWLARDRAAEDPAIVRLPSAAARAADAAAVDWDAECDARLAAGRPGAALEALWWWLAGQLGVEAPASWTARELVERADRRDLLPQVRRFDRLAFAAQPPRAAAVVALRDALRQATGARPLTTGDTT